MAGLVNLQGIEKPFHYDDVARASCYRAVEVEQHLRFSEASRKTVLGFFPVDRAPGIGNQPAFLIANRNHATSGKKARTAIHPDSKHTRRGRRDAAPRQ